MLQLIATLLQLKKSRPQAAVNRERTRRHTLEDSARHLASASISASTCSASARYFARITSPLLILTTSASSLRILSICPMRVHDHAKFALLVAGSSFFGNGLVGGGGAGILLYDTFPPLLKGMITMNQSEHPEYRGGYQYPNKPSRPTAPPSRPPQAPKPPSGRRR